MSILAENPKNSFLTVWDLKYSHFLVQSYVLWSKNKVFFIKSQKYDRSSDLPTVSKPDSLFGPLFHLSIRWLIISFFDKYIKSEPKVLALHRKIALSFL
jgi:hypothetical protein